MIITQTFTMARWQIVVKKSDATKLTKDQNNNKTKNNQKKKTQNTKTGGGNFIWQALFHRLFREIQLNFILQILFYMTVQNRSWRSDFLDLHASFSTLFTSSTPVCLSGLLQNNVLFFPLSSPQWRHLSPTTPILYVHGRCGPFIQ